MALSKNSVYIVIGASGDIGWEISSILIKTNDRVFLTHSPSSDLRQKIQTGQDSVSWHSVNVTDSNSIDEFANLVENETNLNTSPICLIYCAGVLADRPIVKIDDETWHRILDVNLTGAFYCIRRFFRLLSVNGDGKVILLGSIASQKSAIGQAAYAASKAGLEALCRVAALELGRFGVTCNVVAPGAIESDMFRGTNSNVVDKIIKNTPLRKIGLPRDVAYAVMFLLSDESSHITGQTINIDGGITTL